MKLFLIFLSALFLFSPSANAEKGPAKIYYDDTRTWPYQPEKLAGKKGRFYVAVQGEGKIAVVDPEKRSVIKNIPVGPAPHHPWVVPGMRYLYITHMSGDRITIIDTQNDQVMKTLQTGAAMPLHMTFSPTEDLALVGNMDRERGQVTYIDTVKHEITGSVKTNGKMTRDLIFTHDGKYAFLGNSMGPLDLLDVRERKILKSLPVENAGMLRMSPDGKWLLANSAQGYTAIVSVSDLKVAARIEMGSKLYNIDFSPDGKKAYVGAGVDLAVIDLEKKALKTRIPSGTNPNTLFVIPGREVGVVTNEGEDRHVTVVDLKIDRMIKKIPTGRSTHNAHFSADGKYGLITTSQDQIATLIDAEKMEKIVDLEVGAGSNGLKWVPYE